MMEQLNTKRNPPLQFLLSCDSCHVKMNCLFDVFDGINPWPGPLHCIQFGSHVCLAFFLLSLIQLSKVLAVFLLMRIHGHSNSIMMFVDGLRLKVVIHLFGFRPGSRCGCSQICVMIFCVWMLDVLEGSRLVWPFRHQSFNLPRTPCPRVFSFKKKKMQKLMTNFHAHVSKQMANNVVRNSAPHEAWQCTSLTRRAAHMVQSPSPTDAFFANMCFAACEQQRFGPLFAREFNSRANSIPFSAKILTSLHVTTSIYLYAYVSICLYIYIYVYTDTNRYKYM